MLFRSKLGSLKQKKFDLTVLEARSLKSRSWRLWGDLLFASSALGGCSIPWLVEPHGSSSVVMLPPLLCTVPSSVCKSPTCLL